MTTKTDILTGARFFCAHCGYHIVEVQDPYSFVLDYHLDGDFGCSAHPLNDEEGTWGHVPDISIGLLKKGSL